MTGPLTEQEPKRYLLLCLACGEVTWQDEWTYWIRDEAGALVSAPNGTEDPITRCPACGWDHVDDDSNPGIQDGPGLTAERERLLPDYADSWLYRWQEVAKERETANAALSASLLAAQEALRQRDEELRMLRDAWNRHFAYAHPCRDDEPSVPAPTWEDLERWRNAPSDTASGALLGVSAEPLKDTDGATAKLSPVAEEGRNV